MNMTAMKINVYNRYLPGIVIFGLLMATLHPTITAGDSGEIAAAAFSLGIPHPPGYPLYVTIAKSFTNVLPLGNMAYRVNIVSAIFGALTCWMVYLITLKIAGAGLAPAKEGQPQELPLRLAAFFAAASLALSHEFWYRSTVGEVYTLNALLILLIIYVLLVWRGKNSGQWSMVSGQEMGLSPQGHKSLSGGTGILPVITGRDAKFCVSTPVPPTRIGTVPGIANSRLLYLAAFLLGLGIGNHHTIVLIVPGIIAFICLFGSRGGGARSKEQGARSYAAEVTDQSPPRSSLLALRFSLLTLFFLLGLSIYLYLPIRSFKNPFMDWGDPQNLRNFIDVFTRKSYLPHEMERGWEVFVKQLKTFVPVHEFTFIGFLFGLFGIRGLWKANKVVATMLLATFILTSYGLILLAGSSTKDVEILKKFYLPAYTVFSVFIGIGMASAIRSVARGQYPQGHKGPGALPGTVPILHSGTGVETQNIASLPVMTGKMPVPPNRDSPLSHVLRLTLLSLAAASLVWQLASHYPLTRNSDNYMAYDYGMNELNSLRYGAAYISKGEVKTFPLWYLQGVEGYREDVNVVTAYFLTQRWYLMEVLRIAGVPREIPQDLTYKQMLINSIYGGNADKGVYTGFLDEEYIPKDLSTYTQGITFQLYKKPEERSAGDVWSMYRLRGVERVGEWMDRGIVEILTDYASSHYNTGLEYYDEGDIDRAITEFEKALAINPDEPDSLNNLAALYAKKGIKLKEAEGMAKKAFGLYTGEKDREMAKETIEGIEKKMKGAI